MQQHPLPFLGEALLFLSLAGILIPLLQSLRINQVVGFLAAGVLVGPFGLGLLSERFPVAGIFTIEGGQGVDALAELGVLFLMFAIGLELSTARLWALRRWVFAGGTVQLLLTGIAIGALAWAFGNSPATAVVLGLVLALSSTAAVMQLLSERHALGTPLGQAAFAILMLQDLAVVPLFLLLRVMADGETANLLPVLGATFLKSGLAVVLIYLLGQRLLHPVFRYFAREGKPEVFMALTLLTVLGIATLTSATGLSMVLGAFIAGLLLAETEFRHEVDVTIAPFKGLLLGLFFMSVGMQIDLRVLAESPVWIPLSVIGLFAIKAAVLTLVFRAGGLPLGRAVEGGLLMGQGGEFAFIVIGFALTVKLIDGPLAQFMLLVVGLSLFVSPAMSRAGRLWGDWLERRQATPSSPLMSLPESLEGRVLICGFGRIGQLLADILDAEGIAYVALDSDARLASRLYANGRPVYFGDAARADVLRHLQAGTAAAVVLTMDQAAPAMHALAHLRREWPEIPVFARARDEQQALVLRHAGATMAFPETLESGLQIASQVLQRLGQTDAVAAHIVARIREQRVALTDVAHK